MSIAPTQKTIPSYSLDELQKQLKNNPFVDDYRQYSLSAKPKTVPDTQTPASKTTLSKFFNELIDKKIHQVAMMVIFHIVHFFCHMFWKDYREEFDQREATYSKKIKDMDDLKNDKSKLDKKVEDFLKKIPPQPAPQPMD
jgi:hypothetical protein